MAVVRPVALRCQSERLLSDGSFVLAKVSKWGDSRLSALGIIAQSVERLKVDGLRTQLGVSRWVECALPGVMIRAMKVDRIFRVSLTPGQRLDAHYRRGAAILAIVFPLTPATLLVAGLAKNGLGSMTTHPLLFIQLPTGAAAMFFWVKRYSLSALTALRNSEEPIAVSNETIRFFGRSFPLLEASILVVEDKKISLLNGHRLLAIEPTYFVKSRPWRLNC